MGLFGSSDQKLLRLDIAVDADFGGTNWRYATNWAQEIEMADEVNRMYTLTVALYHYGRMIAKFPNDVKDVYPRVARAVEAYEPGDKALPFDRWTKKTPVGNFKMWPMKQIAWTEQSKASVTTTLVKRLSGPHKGLVDVEQSFPFKRAEVIVPASPFIAFDSAMSRLDDKGRIGLVWVIDETHQRMMDPANANKHYLAVLGGAIETLWKR